MVPRLDAVDQRLDILRASPHSAPNLCASTPRCLDGNSAAILYVGSRSQCSWTRLSDWTSFMMSEQVRQRFQVAYNLRRRPTARTRFCNCGGNETGFFRSRDARKGAKLAVSKRDTPVCHNVFVPTSADGELNLEETGSTDGNQRSLDSQALCEDGSKHFPAQPSELSPAFQELASTSTVQPGAAPIDSVGWYADLQDVAANETCDEKHEEPEPPSTTVPREFAPPELTAEMQAEVEAALIPVPPEEVLARGYDLAVRRADIATLNENQWINDTVINFYMGMLVRRAEQRSLRIYAFSTFFYTKLAQSGHGGLKRWTRRIDLFEYHIILVPIHMEKHWLLAVVDFRKSQIVLYDSLGAHARTSCFNILRNYLEEESQHKHQHGINWDEWKFVVPEDVPQQQNFNDCGMFTCQFAECVSRDAPVQFTQQHMPYFRKRVVYEILHSTLL